MRRARIAIPLITAVVASTFAFWAAPAAQAVMAAQPNIVNAAPQANTPDVNDGKVLTIAQVGTQMYLGGTFTSVSPHAQPGTVFSRTSVLAFNAASGAIDTGFVPALTGSDTDVNSVIPGPAPGEVYIGGNFAAVNGVTEHVALLNTTNGQIVSTWKPSAFNGFVNKLVYADGMLFVGGTFTAVGGITHDGLVALNPTTGKLLPYVDLAFTGHHNYGVHCSGTGCANAPTGVKSFDIDPSGQNMVLVGNFTSVGPDGGPGSPRDQVAYVSLGATSATLNASWATDAYTAACFTGAFDSYIRDVQFSTDGSYFVIVGTGGSGTNSDGTNSSCDTAARYETNGTGADVRPTWIDYTGQDSWWSVAITGTAVYVGGHNRWANNSHGYDYAGPGAVPRSGIAALDPQTGLPFSWNPGRLPRGDGARALLATPTGLWVGSDTDYIGPMTILHKKIAFFPLAGGEVVPSNATPTLPGRVYTAGAFPAAGTSNVLYRIDAGGPTIPAIDNGPDWQGDTSDPSPYRNAGSNTAGYAPLTQVDSTVPSSTPLGIFSTERWDPGNDVGDNGNMHWAFPVPAGDVVDVRLYFANRYTGTSQVGQRVFNVSIDGVSFLPNFDIVATAGDQTGTMKDETLTSDGQVTIEFSHVMENPLINGIEIVKESGPTNFSNPVPIYRVHSGGAEINATDGQAADWLEDDGDTVGTGDVVRTGGNVANWGQPWNGTVGPTVPSYVPADIFSTERWAPQTYSFPVAAGTPLTVNLFMANNCSCTQNPGNRIFNVAIDGNPVLSNYDIVEDVGNLIGEMKSFNVTAPANGMVTVALTNGPSDNAVINGVEVDQTGPTPIPPTVNVDRLSYRHYDGTTAGSEVTLSGGIPWGSIRGAFMVNGELFYGKTDGNLYERTYNGSTFGPEVLLDPWADPVWANVQTGSGQTFLGQESTIGAEIPSISSMFYTNGRIYYTLAGNPTMYWRWFETDDGIVGSDEFTVNDGENWSGVAGAFLSGNTLYYADKATGELFSITWNGTQATGAPSVADTSTDWASRGIFMLADATNPNQPPVADFTATCSATSNACTLDDTASMDPDGAITDYTWNYGDGSAIDDHVNDATPFSHNFGAPGKYTVSLTVTDNDGATNTKTKTITVGQSTPVPAFAGVASACGPGTGACGSSATTVVPVPSSTAKGDALLMFVTWPTITTTSASAPSGWTLLGKDSSSPLESDVYYRTATGGDVGSTETVTFSAKTKNSVTIADYHGADSNTIEASAKAFDSNTANHVSPTTTVSTDGSLAVSFWADKSSTTTAWAPPAGVTTQANTFDTGGGYVTSLLADSGSTVNSGSYGGLAAGSSPGLSGKGVEWTIILAPLGTTNAPPVAAFTSNCSTPLFCTFDGSGSFDPDGTVSSWAWTFGDGNTQAASGSSSASNTYAVPGTYPVTLTVTDNGGATTSITHSVTVNGAIANIGFGGANTFDNTSASPSVGIPGSTASGDTLLLFASYASTSIAPTSPSTLTGWTLVGTKTASNLTSLVYEKAAGPSDLLPGASATLGLSGSVKASLTIADYTNVSATPIESSASATSSGTSHVASALAGLASGTWVVSYWTDKSTTTSLWTLPGAVTQRATVYGTAGGAISAALGDSGTAVSGSYPAQTAMTNVSSGSAVQWSIALSPAS